VNRRAQSLAVLAACLLAALVATPRAVQACSCMWPTTAADAYQNADAVFAATAVRSESPFETYADAFHMEVDTVWKGDIKRSEILVAGDYDALDDEMSWNTCHWIPQLHQRTLFFATRKGDYYIAWRCSGTEAWSDGVPPQLLAELEREYGAGESLVPALPTIEGPPEAIADQVERQTVAPKPWRSPWVVLLGSAVAVYMARRAAGRSLRRPLRNRNEV